MNGIQEVVGSIPIGSTKSFPRDARGPFPSHERKIVNRSTRLLTAAALITLIAVAPAGAQLWPFGEPAKAKRAFDEGRLAEALARYRVILEAHPEHDARRGDAMWHIALIRLGAQDPALRDVKRGCRMLDEFAEAYESSPHDVELRALRGLCARAEGREPDYETPPAPADEDEPTPQD